MVAYTTAVQLSTMLKPINESNSINDWVFFLLSRPALIAARAEGTYLLALGRDGTGASCPCTLHTGSILTLDGFEPKPETKAAAAGECS